MRSERSPAPGPAAAAISSRVEAETSAGHKRVRLDHVWAVETGAFERWGEGEPGSRRRAA